MASKSQEEQQTKDAYSRLNSYIRTDRQNVNPHFLNLFIEEKIRTNELDFSSFKGKECIEHTIQKNREDILSSIFKQNVELIEQQLKIKEFTKYTLTPLQLSTYFNATECLKILIQNGADFEACDEGGNTALLHACHDGNTEVAEVLVKHGADVNCTDILWRTPLMLCQNGNLCQLLLDHKADIEATDDDGNTALLHACDEGDPEVAEVLIKHRANTNCSDSKRKTPLMYCQSGNICKLLLDHKADTEACDHYGNTALLLACSEGSNEVAEVLIKHRADVNCFDIGSITPLMSCQNKNLCQLLLDHQADIEARDEDGHTALSHACNSGRTEVAEVLVRHGADVNCSNIRERTPLMLCQNEKNICQLLLDNKADIEACDKDGNTALVYACMKGCTAVAEVLLKNGADVNCSDSEGRTPLMIEYKCISDASKRMIMKTLVVNGSSVNATDKWGQTPLYHTLDHMGTDHQDVEGIIDDLLNAGASELYSPKQTVSLLTTLIEKNFKIPINTLLSRVYVHVNCKDSRGQTPLMIFARDGNTDFMEKTINHGALLDDTDLNGKNALMYGSMPKHQCSAVIRLIAAGADVNITDQDGINALMFTCKSGCYNCSEQVLAKGVDINARTIRGQTAMSYALTNFPMRKLERGSFSNTRDLVKLLLVKGATLDLCKIPSGVISDVKMYYRFYEYIIFLYTMLHQYSCRQCVFRLVSEIRLILTNNHADIDQFSVITNNKVNYIMSILQTPDEDIAKIYSTAFKCLLQQYPREIRLEHIAAMAVREAYGIDHLAALVERGDFPRPIYDIFVDIVSPQKLTYAL
ncbi:unnamed protein product [Owenia fusiformis]|uniref:Uncharacterized protein n=1 Tax=Owenia fusiformis TaxID=6347 RepID=A0A8J1U5K6_OWEFU|nr:unnamed protein product [Owenia fusiformis]